VDNAIGDLVIAFVSFNLLLSQN